MSRIIRLTESDLTRIVRRVIREEEESKFDFSQTEKRLLHKFFTEKNDFEYEGIIEGKEIYSLSKRGFKVMVATKMANDPYMVILQVFVKFPMGNTINYLQDVERRSSYMELPIDDYNSMTRTIQGAIDFGNAKHGYDNLVPLPRF